jgi:type VI secretion system secreted protein Hcp
MPKTLSHFLFVLMALVAAETSQAADVFLQLTNVAGESRDAEYRDSIDVLSFSWGGRQPGGTRTGSYSGKATLDDVTVVKHVDKASPLLTSIMCAGKMIPEANIIVRYSPEGKNFNYQMKLERVMISSYQLGYGGGPEGMVETITLNFSKVRWIYQSADPKTPGTFEKGFDVMQNMELK